MKKTGTGKRMIIQLAIAAGVGIVVSMLCAMTVALLIHTDTVSMDKIGFGAVAGLLLSSFMCGVIGRRVEGFAPFVAVMSAELCLWGFLMVLNMALFDFSGSGAAATAGVLAAGGTAALLLVPKEKSKATFGRKKKIKL